MIRKKQKSAGSNPHHKHGPIVVQYCQRGKLFCLQLELFCSQLSFFAYSLLRPLLDALSIVSKKAPTESKNAEIVGKRDPIVSIKAKIVNCK